MAKNKKPATVEFYHIYRVRRVAGSDEDGGYTFEVTLSGDDGATVTFSAEAKDVQTYAAMQRCALRWRGVVFSNRDFDASRGRGKESYLDDLARGIRAGDLARVKAKEKKSA